MIQRITPQTLDLEPISYNAKRSPTQGLLLVVAGTGFEPATPRV